MNLYTYCVRRGILLYSEVYVQGLKNLTLNFFQSFMICSFHCITTLGTCIVEISANRRCSMPVCKLMLEKMKLLVAECIWSSILQNCRTLSSVYYLLFTAVLPKRI